MKSTLMGAVLSLAALTGTLAASLGNSSSLSTKRGGKQYHDDDVDLTRWNDASFIREQEDYIQHIQPSWNSPVVYDRNDLAKVERKIAAKSTKFPFWACKWGSICTSGLVARGDFNCKACIRFVPQYKTKAGVQVEPLEEGKGYTVDSI
ncbi:Uu.00g028640.m01.CDS01 [Anthostomella pinea]|uniref:Uu.00g028640.m01.CDS01 n=1 Tax=Anthostomella pinea TaxID=933095 RepID=A0AAI8YCQ6_9PEZI|nr:Uu.00g028640.m01.CDS01 [Anthostomella pinea]